jgi:pimeloyl-ACP methyl ester carboxylesterase
MITDYSGWHWVNRNPHTSLMPADIDRLDKIKSPALVITGERDLPDFQAVAEILRKQIPGAQRAVLPGVGHMVNLEAPERFNQIILEFLKSV